MNYKNKIDLLENKINKLENKILELENKNKYIKNEEKIFDILYNHLPLIYMTIIFILGSIYNFDLLYITVSMLIFNIIFYFIYRKKLFYYYKMMLRKILSIKI